MEALPARTLPAIPPLSLLTMGETGPEPFAVKRLLECLPYRVTVHRDVGRQKLLGLLGGDVPTAHLVILSCHGHAFGLRVPYAGPVSAAELSGKIRLPGRTVLCLGCHMGTDAFAAAFLGGGAAAYIAPTAAMDVFAEVLFLVYLFGLLSRHYPLAEAIDRSRKKDADCALFKLFTPETVVGPTHRPTGWNGCIINAHTCDGTPASRA